VDVDETTPDHHDSFSFPRLPHSQNMPEKWPTNSRPCLGILTYIRCCVLD
jgi:hypothetical protein